VINLHPWQGRYWTGSSGRRRAASFATSYRSTASRRFYSSQRDEVRLQIQGAWARCSSPQGLELVGFILRNVAFHEKVRSAIERNRSPSRVLRAQFLVSSRRRKPSACCVERKAGRRRRHTRGRRCSTTVLRAQADAEALRLISEAIAVNPDLLTYRYIEKLSPTIRTALLPSDAPFLLDINSLLPPSVATPAPQPTPTPEATPAP
jgi:regulator of protease activity HflC (stomatin/prohibitin superfamily)